MLERPDAGVAGMPGMLAKFARGKDLLRLWREGAMLTLQNAREGEDFSVSTAIDICLERLLGRLPFRSNNTHNCKKAATLALEI